MSDLRKAAQMALDALVEWDALIMHQYTGTRVGMSDMTYAAQATPPVINALRAALAQPEPEPVAWMEPDWLNPQERTWPGESFTANPINGWLPLYTAPPQRKPLTEEEIRCSADKARIVIIGEASIAFARAIERAHGIE